MRRSMLLVISADCVPGYAGCSGGCFKPEARSPKREARSEAQRLSRGDNSSWIMRVLAIDVGQRRVGLAISDPTATLARPLTTLAVNPDDALDKVAHEIAQLAAEEDGISEIVVGRPLRLDGSPDEQTAHVTRFVAALQSRTPIPIRVADERLTSREAESRLALNDKNWRSRKARLDAAAAAVILQDYLDARA